MSDEELDELDKFVDRAIAALEAVSSAELEAFCEQFAARRRWDKRGPWYRFGVAFGTIARTRGDEGGNILVRWELRDAIKAVDDEFLAAIKEAGAPFSRVVREAAQARRAVA